MMGVAWIGVGLGIEDWLSVGRGSMQVTSKKADGFEA